MTREGEKTDMPREGEKMWTKTPSITDGEKRMAYIKQELSDQMVHLSSVRKQETQDLTQVARGMADLLYSISTLVIPILLGAAVDISARELIKDRPTRVLIRRSIGVVYALTWLLAFPCFYTRWCRVKKLLSALPVSHWRKESAETVGAVTEVEESVSDDSSESDENTCKSTVEDIVGDDKRDKPNEGQASGSQEQECGDGDQEEKSTTSLVNSA